MCRFFVIIKRSYKIILISLVPLIFFILDRILKYLVLAGKIFGMKNYDFALSIKLPIPDFIIIFLYSCIFIFLIYLLVKNYNKNLLQVTSYGLLITGLVSNLLDRLKFGFVIDYVNFYFFYNNLADVMIWIGVILLIISLFLENKKRL